MQSNTRLKFPTKYFWLSFKISNAFRLTHRLQEIGGNNLLYQSFFVPKTTKVLRTCCHQAEFFKPVLTQVKDNALSNAVGKRQILRKEAEKGISQMSSRRFQAVKEGKHII